MTVRTFHWFRHYQIPDALALGWVIAKPNTACHHHDWAFLCEWLCDCKMARPQ